VARSFDWDDSDVNKTIRQQQSGTLETWLAGSVTPETTMISLHDLSDEFASPAAPVSASVSVASGLKAYIARALAVTIAAREAKADRLVARYLAQHDPDGLLGQKSSDIQAFRR
jgi:hypothetical protein